MYNIGTGDSGGGMTGGQCSPVVTMTLPIQMLELLGDLNESLDLLATRPTPSPVINIEIPETNVPAPSFNVPAQAAPVVTVAAPQVHVRFEVPPRLFVYLAGINSLSIAAVYYALKFL